jgi:hypothetical protein
MTNITAHYLELARSLKSLEEEVLPYKERFYEFLAKNEPGIGFDDYSLSAFGETPAVYRYDLNIHKLAEGSGMTFETEVYDYGDSHTLHFTIPDSYLADPDAFEKKFHDEMAQNKNLAEYIIRGVFGQKVSDTVKVYAEYFDYSSNSSIITSDKKFLLITLDVPKGKFLGETDEHKFLLNASAPKIYTWDYETGDLYYGGLGTAHSIAIGREKNKPLGNVTV